MKIEVLKIYDVEIEGKKSTILGLDDFKRLCSDYQITLDLFKDKLGLTRSLWDSTLKYHNINRDDILAWRNNVLLHNKLHLNSNRGFSKIIKKSELLQNPKDTVISKYLESLSIIEPNIKDIWYSKMNKDPQSLSQDLVNIGRYIIELSQVSKKLHNRVRKQCIKKGVEHNRRISSVLENTVANILDELGLIYQTQLFISPYHYDFVIGKVILEIDGGGHNDRFDKDKEVIAKSHGFNIVRVKVDRKGIKKNNYDTYKNTINKKLGSTNSI